MYVKKEKEKIKLQNGGQKISSKGGAENAFYDGELEWLEQIDSINIQIKLIFNNTSEL